mmetsp:Transcript_22305/g.48536  ORF Transcript_22305/g.48536 Transcript_22305/m.48536 type:complete len:416 (+) Transcript_22305:146-1393(+)
MISRASTIPASLTQSQKHRDGVRRRQPNARTISGFLLLMASSWVFLYLLIASRINFHGDGIDPVPKSSATIGSKCEEGDGEGDRVLASTDELPSEFSIYLPSIPDPDNWPSPLDKPAYLEEDEPINANLNITITTCIPVMTRQIDIELNLPWVLQSIQKQTVLADEVAIVISDVDRLRSQWKKQGGESGWCSFIIEFVRAYIPNVPRIRVACVGGRLTAGWARNVLARLATSSVLSFVDADDEEYSVRNEVTRSMFECYRGQLNLLLHSYSRGKFLHKYEILHKYKEEEKGNPRYGVKPGDKCADDELARPLLGWSGPPLVTYGDNLYDLMWETFDGWVLGNLVAHGHMVVHKRVFLHVKFTVLAKGEDALFARDVIMTFGRRRNATIFLCRPLTWYRKAGGANKDLLVSSNPRF